MLWFRACDKFHTSQETARNITFNITFSFLLYSLGENRFAYSNELLRFNRKSINPIQKYPHIIESCLYSINICCNIFISNEVSNFFWNMFNSKTIKVYYILSIYIQTNPMSSYWFIPIRIYYICPIPYFRKNFSWIKAIKVRFVLIIL